MISISFKRIGNVAIKLFLVAAVLTILTTAGEKNTTDISKQLYSDTLITGCELKAIGGKEKKEATKVVKKHRTIKKKHYSENDAIHIAKVLYNECRGIESKTEKACVAWVILNRKDKFEKDVESIVTAPYQFAYFDDTPVDDELLDLAHDVLSRWNREQNGEQCVGRVLPKDYIYFTGDGSHNHFRNELNSAYVWQYTLKSPYCS